MNPQLLDHGVIHLSRSPQNFRSPQRKNFPRSPQNLKQKIRTGWHSGVHSELLVYLSVIYIEIELLNPNKNYKDLSLSANKSTQRYGKIPNKLFFGGWIDRSPQNFLANHLVPPEYRGPPTFFSKSQVPPWKPTFLKIRSPQNHGGVIPWNSGVNLKVRTSK